MSGPRRGARSVARECALMVLFGTEMTKDDAERAVQAFFRELAAEAVLPPEDEARSYAAEIARGVEADLTRIDAAISAASDHWRIERMSRVDRNVLRIGAWELMQKVPRAIAIDEAIELAKRLGTADSGPFVNGLLSRLADDLEQA